MLKGVLGRIRVRIRVGVLKRAIGCVTACNRVFIRVR